MYLYLILRQEFNSSLSASFFEKYSKFFIVSDYIVSDYKYLKNSVVLILYQQFFTITEVELYLHFLQI